MKIYAVVFTYDDGVWLSDDPDWSDDVLLFSTLELAQTNKQRIDTEEYKEHSGREAKRYDRWVQQKAARALLEANKFEGIGYVFPGVQLPFEPYEFKSKSRIMILEVQE